MGLSKVAAWFLLSLGVAFALPAPAEEKAKTERSSGRIVKYDAKASTVTLKDKGKEILFHVTQEGSVLTRTTVTLNARPAKLDDIKAGAPAFIYWRPNASDPTRKDARKIDLPNVPKELQEDEE